MASTRWLSDIRYWHKADMTAAFVNVRFQGKSGQPYLIIEPGERIIQKKSPAEAGRRRGDLFADLQIARRLFAPVGNNIIVDRRAFIEVA